MKKQDRRVKQVVRDVFSNDDQSVRDKVACWGFHKTFFGYNSVQEAQFPVEGVLATVFYVPPGKIGTAETDQLPRFVQGMVIAQNSPQGWDQDFHDVGEVLAQLRQDDEHMLEKEKELRLGDASPAVLAETYQELADLQKDKLVFLKE